MSFFVSTRSEARYKAIMRFLDQVEDTYNERGLNQGEWNSLTNFKLKVNRMRFGARAELEYPHWAEIYNRIQVLLDAPRRVPIAPGQPTPRRPEDMEEQGNIIDDLYEQEFGDREVPDEAEHPENE